MQIKKVVKLTISRTYECEVVGEIDLENETLCVDEILISEEEINSIKGDLELALERDFCAVTGICDEAREEAREYNESMRLEYCIDMLDIDSDLGD